MREIKNPFRKWWQFWKPQHIDLTEVGKKKKFSLGAQVVHNGVIYRYYKGGTNA